VVGVTVARAEVVAEPVEGTTVEPEVVKKGKTELRPEWPSPLEFALPFNHFLQC
jgi:hypothetical protein